MLSCRFGEVDAYGTLEKFVFFVAYRDYARAQEQLEALLAPDDHAADADFADEDEESEDEDE